MIDPKITQHTVITSYINLIDNDEISFLSNKNVDDIKKLRNWLIELRDTPQIHKKIENAYNIWIYLFEQSMSYIDVEKEGYDELFEFFKKYIDFEELLFASDSIYRDHTLHSIWVYLLGEYLIRDEAFDPIFRRYKFKNDYIRKLQEFFIITDSKEFSTIIEILDDISKVDIYYEAIRCVGSLTHDLGYPLKIINKINKCISNILGDFSILNMSEFDFSFNTAQKPFIEEFLCFLSSEFEIKISNNKLKNEYSHYRQILNKYFEFKEENFRGIKTDIVKPNDLETDILKKVVDPIMYIIKKVPFYFRYANDFEKYNHGIMSAFLLMKLVKAFSNTKFIHANTTIKIGDVDYTRYSAKKSILEAISDHTSDGFRIDEIDNFSKFLTFIDEIEEFSRISRANKWRQYVQQFCHTTIGYEDGIFKIKFTFDDPNLDKFECSKFFKDRCKRFLSLFQIEKLDTNLKILLECVDQTKVGIKETNYSLQIGRNQAVIMVDHVAKDNIPEFLESKSFYSSSQYETLCPII